MIKISPATARSWWRLALRFNISKLHRIPLGVAASFSPTSNSGDVGSPPVVDSIWMPGALSRWTRQTCQCLIIFAALIGIAAPVAGQTIYEAENATMSGFVFDNQYTGYSGTGDARDNNVAGDYLEFSLVANVAGTYPITFRYANGGTANRPLSLSINGAVVTSSLSFPITGGWSSWAFTATNEVTLTTGPNTVRLTDIGSSGPHVDYLAVETSGTVSPAPVATNAPLRRPVSPNQPMWLVHLDTWNYPDPQKIINLIPQDIRPYVVMNISLSIDESTNGWLQCAYGQETATSWLRICAENGMWAVIQPASGGQSHFSDFDLTVYEQFFREYPNFLGFNYAEQFWGYGPPLAVTWTQRVAHWVDLMKLNQKYGGYLIVSWCGNQYDPNINPIAMLKLNPAFAAICQQSPKNFILEEKYTQQSYQSDMESVCLGDYVAGYSGQYGIRYDQTGWTDANGNATNFTMASAGAPLLEHGMLTGETVIDGPEIIWLEDIQGLNNGTTADGYTTRNWGLYPQYPNVILDIFRKILDGTVRIPGRQEVINRTKAIIINNVNSGSADNLYSSPQTMFEGLYRMDGDGDYSSNKNFMKETGRYPTVPTVYQLADANARSFQVQVSNSLYSTRWPTTAAKTNEFNSLFAQEYTGDIYAGRNENGWVIYNPYKTGLTNGQTASGSIPFKYNTCDHMDLTLAQYTAGVIKEYSNSLSIYLGNYDNFLNLGMRTDVFSIYGSSLEPTYAYVDRASHAASSVTTGWSGGVFTLNITHNGPLDLTVNCSGAATGRLTTYTPAAITLPAKPLVYTGPHQYEAENFDYKSIGGDVTQGIGTSVSNYNAMGYLNFGTSSSARARDTNITVLESGVYRLDTKYAVTGPTIGSVDLYVNGAKVATPNFTPVAALSNWATNSQYVSLKARTNSIEFRANAAGASALYFDDIVVVPTVYDTGVIIQENGPGFEGVNGTIGNADPGYTGLGYASASNSYGAGIDWSVNFDSSVTKALTFRYAATNDVTADLLVNGTNVAANLQFHSTGALTNWDYATVYPYISPGASDVRLQATTNIGLPYIDYVEIMGMQPFPAFPTGLTATGAYGVINLNWTQSTNADVTTNRVYRSATGASGSFARIASISAATAYADPTVAIGTAYYFAVTAVNTNGESVLSNTAMAVASSNSPPILAPISGRTIGAGITLDITNSAADVDAPPQELTYNLLIAPSNAVLDANSGVLIWRPLVTQANSISPFVIQVADNGVPRMSATQSFVVTVTNLTKPMMSIPLATSGQLILKGSGDYGPDYQIQASSNLVNWSVLFSTNSAAMPFVWTNTNPGAAVNFFRILAGPPF